MYRLAIALAVATSLGLTTPSLAQGPSSKDDLKKLEAEIAKLRAQLEEAEARLSKMKALTDPAQFVRLTSITVAMDGGIKAELYDRFNSNAMSLRLAPGADTFLIKNAQGMVTVSGRAVHLSAREIVFQAGDMYYAVRLGQTLAEALRKPLNKERVKELKLPPTQ